MSNKTFLILAVIIMILLFAAIAYELRGLAIVI